MARLLKLPEVAQRLEVSEKTARRYVKAGVLPSVFVGNAYRVNEEDVEEYLRRAKVEVGDNTPKAPSRSSPEAPKIQAGEERRNLEDVWKEQYLAHVDKMLDKWEDELEEKLALAESDLVRFFEWLEEVREYGRPLMSGVVSGYTATSRYRLEAVANAARFLSPWDDLWLRIEERIDQTTTFSEEDAKHFRELREEARAVQ